MTLLFRLSLAVSFAFVSTISAADAPKGLELKIVLKSDSFEYGGKGGLAQLKTDLEAVGKKDGKLGFGAKNLPPVFPIALDLVITNTGKEAQTVYILGDPNVWEFTTTGPGVKVVRYNLAQTLEFRLPQLTVIEAGKSFRIPVGQLEDGSRGRGRRTYLTAAGEYKLTATYKLANQEGDIMGTLQSEPVKLTVTEAK